MLSRLAADAVLLIHFGFIAFVVGGALLVAWRTWIAWIHLPAAAWGAYVEIAGRICPLTFLENRLRIAAGQEGYSESFIEHYLVPVMYPSGLTRTMQFVLAGAVIVINLAAYAWILRRTRKTRISKR